MWDDDFQGEQSQLFRALTSDTSPTMHSTSSKGKQKACEPVEDASTSRLVENPLLVIPSEQASSSFRHSLPQFDDVDVAACLQGPLYAPFNDPYPTAGSSSLSQILPPTSQEPSSVNEWNSLVPLLWNDNSAFLNDNYHGGSTQAYYPHLSDASSGSSLPIPSPKEPASGLLPMMKENIPPLGYVPQATAILYDPPPYPPPGWRPYPEDWIFGDYGALLVNSSDHQFDAAIAAPTTNPKRKRKYSESEAVKGKGKKKAKTGLQAAPGTSQPYIALPATREAAQIMDYPKKCLWTLGDGSTCGYEYKGTGKKIQKDGTLHYNRAHADADVTECLWENCTSDAPGLGHFRRSHFTPGWCSWCKGYFSRSDSFKRHLKKDDMCPNDFSTWAKVRKAGRRTPEGIEDETTPEELETSESDKE